MSFTSELLKNFKLMGQAALILAIIDFVLWLLLGVPFLLSAAGAIGLGACMCFGLVVIGQIFERS